MLSLPESRRSDLGQHCDPSKPTSARVSTSIPNPAIVSQEKHLLITPKKKKKIFSDGFCNNCYFFQCIRY